MVERRCEARGASRLQVDISHNEQYVGRFSTANSGEHSVFVEMNAAGLHTGDVVMVSFIANAGVARRMTHLAEVTRITDAGIAIVFSLPCCPSSPPARLPRTGS